MKYEHLLPDYDGLDGKGNGPRYCPSLYKKVIRFPDRTSHNSFLEPEGIHSNIVYPNGMSGPYPEEIQLQIMRSMKGLENVEITSPGYDVEYDFINPLQQVTHTLETKKIGGLYLAGQICGTTGYEEAAAQGIIAGANAGRSTSSHSTDNTPFILGRDESYIGTLIDDLVTRGTTEPYRMFTSRSEYRISLRADNADMRLTQRAIDANLVGSPNNRNNRRVEAFKGRQRALDDSLERLRNVRLNVVQWGNYSTDDKGNNAIIAHEKNANGKMKTAEEVLKMPHVTLKTVEDAMNKYANDMLSELSSENDNKVVNNEELIQKANSLLEPTPQMVSDTVEATVKYSSYISRQEGDMALWRKSQGMKIPGDIIYSHDMFPTFSSEEIEKLNNIRPPNFAEASNISGLTPQTLVYLYNYVSKRGGNQFRDRERNKKAKARQAAATSAAITNNQ